MNYIRSFFQKQYNDIKVGGKNEFFKKLSILIKYIFFIFLSPIYFFFYIFIRLLSPFYLIRIQRMPTTNFGNFAAYPAVYYCKKKFAIDQPKQKFLDLFYISIQDKIYNRQLAKMWKRKLIFLSPYILEPISYLNKFFSGWQKHTVEILYSKLERDVKNLLNKCQPLEFTKEEENMGQSCLLKFGLNKDDKFVCLAVRDSAYQSRKVPLSKEELSYQDYRNNNIDDFILASEELTKRGYFVFRMGVVVNKPFKTKNKKIIDYANSNLRNDFMDIYLASKCTFCISTGLGFDDVPHIFNKHIALISVPVGDLRTFSNKFLLLTKNHYFKKEKRNLSLSEIFSYGVGLAYETQTFQKKGIELIDCSPQEISNFVLEMEEKIKSINDFDKEDEILQRKFKEVFIKNYKKYGFSRTRFSKNLLLHDDVIRSSFSKNFLKKNRDWLN